MKKILHKKLVIPTLAIVIFFSTTAFKNDFFEIAKQIEIFTTLFKELNMNYVDDTNPGDLMDTAIKSMLDDLDPYTQFYNEQDVESARINNAGDYTGVGAKVLTALGLTAMTNSILSGLKESHKQTMENEAEEEADLEREASKAPKKDDPKTDEIYEEAHIVQ